MKAESIPVIFPMAAGFTLLTFMAGVITHFHPAHVNGSFVCLALAAVGALTLTLATTIQSSNLEDDNFVILKEEVRELGNQVVRAERRTTEAVQRSTANEIRGFGYILERAVAVKGQATSSGSITNATRRETPPGAYPHELEREYREALEQHYNRTPRTSGYMQRVEDGREPYYGDTQVNPRPNPSRREVIDYNGLYGQNPSTATGATLTGLAYAQGPLGQVGRSLSLADIQRQVANNTVIGSYTGRQEQPMPTVPTYERYGVDVEDSAE